MFEKTESCCFGKWKVWNENAKIQFSAYMQATDLLQTFYRPTQTSLFHRTQYNVHFLFSSIACGVKHALQLRFCTKPNSASYQKFPFRTGSKHGRAYRGTNKLLQTFLIRCIFQILAKKLNARVLNRTLGIQRVATLWCTFWLLFRTSEKVTQKTSLLETFREKKSFL